MRERCEDVDLHGGTLVALGEATRHQDAAALEVDVEDAVRHQRQREARVELEDVVRHSRGHVLHGSERTTPLLLHGEADELEDVVAAFLGRRELVSRNGEDGAALDRPVQPDDSAPPGTFRRDHRGGLFPRQQARADGEALRIVACVLDDEGAVEAVRAAHAAHRNQVGHCSTR